jgi:hypothetical protein
MGSADFGTTPNIISTKQAGDESDKTKAQVTLTLSGKKMEILYR